MAAGRASVGPPHGRLLAQSPNATLLQVRLLQLLLRHWLQVRQVVIRLGRLLSLALCSRGVSGQVQ